jgi:hypothetical protein
MRTNKSFRITYFDASTSENVGYAGFINLGGETINTDEWALLNMPDEVAELQDSTEILWDAESVGPAVAEACHMQERVEPRKPPYDPRMQGMQLRRRPHPLTGSVKLTDGKEVRYPAPCVWLCLGLPLVASSMPLWQQ